MLEADYEPERMEYIRQDAGCVLKIDKALFSEIMVGAALEGYEETSLHDLALPSIMHQTLCVRFR